MVSLTTTKGALLYRIARLESWFPQIEYYHYSVMLAQRGWSGDGRLAVNSMIFRRVTNTLDNTLDTLALTSNVSLALE